MPLINAIVLAFAFALLGSLGWGFLQWHTGILAGPIAYGIGWGAAMGVSIGLGRRFPPIASLIAGAIALIGVAMAKVAVILAAKLDGAESDDWGAWILDQYSALDLVWAALALWPVWSFRSDAKRSGH